MNKTKTNPKNIKMYELKKNRTNFPIMQVNSSKKIVDYLRQFYSNDIDIFESFFMLTLDRAHNTTGFVKISQGGVFATVVDIRLVAKYAVDSLCSGVVICHNHPSGNTTPSAEDKAVTAKIKEALKYFDIRLIDHIILTHDNHLSFVDEGLIIH